MLYEEYATKSDLAAFLGVNEDQLPEDSERLLKRASELVKQSIIIWPINTNPYSNVLVNETDEKNKEAMKLATCAQVEYWINFGENISMEGLQNFSLGDLSMSMNVGQNKNILCERARAFLNQQGLLYRGIKGV